MADTGENFALEIKSLIGAEVEVVKRNELHTFAVLKNAGLLNVLLVGLINAAAFGKTVSVNCKIQRLNINPCKWK